MKTKLILAALIATTSLLGGESPIITAEANHLGISVGSTVTPQIDFEKSFQSGVTFFDNSAAKVVLTISGLAVMQFKTPQPTYDNGIHYAQPEKPEEVKITLTTKDGKNWRAVWVEEKP